MRDEEQTGHAEAVLSTAVGRYAWAGSHLVFSLLGPALALFRRGTGRGADLPVRRVGGVIGARSCNCPRSGSRAAVAVLLFGLLPKLVDGGLGSTGDQPADPAGRRDHAAQPLAAGHQPVHPTYRMCPAAT